MEDIIEETKIEDILERDGVETEIVKEKPYKLRKLSAKDISPMVKIIKKIDLKRLKNVFSELDLKQLTQNMQEEQNEELEESNNMQDTFAQIGGALIFEAIPMILDALDNAIEDINKLLASVSGMELLEIENMDLNIYFELIYDFIKKEEFAGFIKVASRFLK